MAKDWYILYVHAGYEAKVVSTIQQRLKKSEFAPSIGQIKIPLEHVDSNSEVKRSVKSRNFWPGYVLIELDLPNEKTEWLSVCSFLNHVRGVKSLIGMTADSKPIAISQDEVRNILEKMGEIKTLGSIISDKCYSVNQSVRIKEGPFHNFVGVIEEVNYEKNRVKICVHIFGRSTPVELDFSQIEVS